MPNLITYRVEGLDALKDKLKSYLSRTKEGVDNVLRDSVERIGMKAKANCKIQSIAATITTGKIDDSYEVNTTGVISVYLEFGTGNFAKTLLGNYPQDWKDMAMLFFINGKGRMPSQPYLYPAYLSEKVQIEQKIKEEIERH